MSKTPSRKPVKDNSLRNAIIAFGVALLGYASIFQFHRLSDFLLGGGIALLVASLIKVMTTPMKGLSAPSSSDKLDPDSVQDEYARQTIARGLELLAELRGERDAINEYVFNRRLNELANNYAGLLNRVVADHDKASHLRKLNSYYIPTAVKLLQSYREAKGSGTSYMEISATREDILKSLDQLIAATNTLKKQMVKSNLETIDIKCEVLEDILKADGYIENEMTSKLRTTAEEAAQQIPMPGHAAQPQAQYTGVQQAEKPAGASAPLQSAQPTRPVRKLYPIDLSAPSKPAARHATERPTIQVSMPTASAKTLQQGAPVLQVPGMSAEEDGNARKANSAPPRI